LLDAVAHRTLAIEDRKLRSYEGGWAELVRRREERERTEEPVSKPPKQKAKPIPVRPVGPTPLERLEGDIERQEQTVADLEQRLAEDWGNVELLTAHRAARDELKQLLARWEVLFEKA
jgi:ATP-binding cassette subfamily F protein 3